MVGRGRYNLLKSMRSGFKKAGRGIRSAARVTGRGVVKGATILGNETAKALRSRAGQAAIGAIALSAAQGAMSGGPAGALAAATATGGTLLDNQIKTSIMNHTTRGRGMYATTGMRGSRSGSTKRSFVSGRGTYSGGASAPYRNSSKRIVQGNLHGSKVAKFGNSRHDFGGCTYENQEFYQYIYAPDAVNGQIPFTSMSVEVQPGMMTPMLSQMAKNFKFYQMVGCVFHFETLLDGAALQSETGQVGSIYMHSFADSKSTDFASSGEFEHQDYVNSAKITEGLTCGVECDPKMLSGLDNSGVNMIRYSAVDTSNLNEYDQGRVQIALDGLNPALAGRVIGKLRVSYKVELIKNQLVSALGRGSEADFWTRSDRAVTPVLNNTKPSFFGSYSGEDRLMTAQPSNNMGVTFRTHVPSTIYHGDVTELKFPANLEGFFKLSIRVNTSSLTEIDPEDGTLYGQAQMMLGGNVQTSDTVANTCSAGVLTCGNIEVVPKVGTVLALGAANAGSYTLASSTFQVNKTGSLVVADYTEYADSLVDVVDDSGPGNRNLLLDGQSRVIGVHKLVDTPNSFVYTANANQGSTDLPKFCATGLTEVYVRLRPSTGGVVNKMLLLNGLEYSEHATRANGSPFDAVEVSVERCDDHSKFDSVYGSL
jgi:hypothetical protein